MTINIAPIIDFTDIPKNEWEAVGFVQKSLNSLEDRVIDFKHCLSLARYASDKANIIDLEFRKKTDLFLEDNSSDILDSRVMPSISDYNDNRREFSDWLHVAVRHGAIVAYEFWMATQSLNHHLGVAATLRKRVDQRVRKLAQKTFTDCFPSIASVRLSAAHGSELGSSKADIDKHAFRTGSDDTLKLFINGSVSIQQDSFSYQSSIKNQIVSYQLSDSTLLALSLCVKNYWEAFTPAESSSSKWHRNSGYAF